MSTDILSHEQVQKRKPVQLESLAGKPLAGTGLRAKAEGTQIWFNARGIRALDERGGLMLRLAQFGYTGVVVTEENLGLLAQLPGALQPIAIAETREALQKARALVRDRLIVVSSQADILAEAASAGATPCLYQYVDDGDSLHRAIHQGKAYPFLMIRFRDPTNIPLELVIASLQPTGTTLIKEINEPSDVDDAVVTLGVMEVGADGVMYSPDAHDLLESFGRRFALRSNERMALETATVVRAVPIGMGYRSCIDLASLFTEREGMLVGSTSQGGILCCPEVFFLPYMETRPFRVNAGGVHSYVYNSEGRTSYMSELASGASVMIVGLDGKTRKAPVGRIKTEMRPLRLIEAAFESGETINVILQDDWHVRVFSPEGAPLNITELRAGSKVLAHKASPGRHVGIKIDENILEN